MTNYRYQTKTKEVFAIQYHSNKESLLEIIQFIQNHPPQDGELVLSFDPEYMITIRQKRGETFVNEGNFLVNQNGSYIVVDKDYFPEKYEQVIDESPKEKVFECISDQQRKDLLEALGVGEPKKQHKFSIGDKVTKKDYDVGTVIKTDKDELDCNGLAYLVRWPMANGGFDNWEYEDDLIKVSAQKFVTGDIVTLKGYPTNYKIGIVKGPFGTKEQQLFVRWSEKSKSVIEYIDDLIKVSDADPHIEDGKTNGMVIGDLVAVKGKVEESKDTTYKYEVGDFVTATYMDGGFQHTKLAQIVDMSGDTYKIDVGNQLFFVYEADLRPAPKQLRYHLTYDEDNKRYEVHHNDPNDGDKCQVLSIEITNVLPNQLLQNTVPRTLKPFTDVFPIDRTSVGTGLYKEILKCMYVPSTAPPMPDHEIMKQENEFVLHYKSGTYNLFAVCNNRAKRVNEDITYFDPKEFSDRELIYKGLTRLASQIPLYNIALQGYRNELSHFPNLWVDQTFSI